MPISVSHCTSHTLLTCKVRSQRQSAWLLHCPSDSVLRNHTPWSCDCGTWSQPSSFPNVLSNTLSKHHCVQEKCFLSHEPHYSSCDHTMTGKTSCFISRVRWPCCPNVSHLSSSCIYSVFPIKKSFPLFLQMPSLTLCFCCGFLSYDFVFFLVLNLDRSNTSVSQFLWLWRSSFPLCYWSSHGCPTVNCIFHDLSFLRFPKTPGEHPSPWCQNRHPLTFLLSPFMYTSCGTKNFLNSHQLLGRPRNLTDICNQEGIDPSRW